MQKEELKQHRLQQEARRLFGAAVREGKLTRPDKCSRCGEPERFKAHRRNQKQSIIEGHHPDYTKPLEVIWLCTLCHRGEHARLKRLGNSRRAKHLREQDRIKAVKSASTETKPVSPELSREDIERDIAGITESLKGPLSNLERGLLVADRRDLRARLAEMNAERRQETHECEQLSAEDREYYKREGEIQLNHPDGYSGIPLSFEED